MIFRIDAVSVEDALQSCARAKKMLASVLHAASYVFVAAQSGSKRLGRQLTHHLSRAR